MPNRLPKENWYFGWQASCGAYVAPQPSNPDFSRFQARHLLQFRQKRQADQDRQVIIEAMYQNAVTITDPVQPETYDLTNDGDSGPNSSLEHVDGTDDLTRSFVRLSNLPTYPLDRLSRYEATLWRQACQTLFALQSLHRRKPWERGQFRVRQQSGYQPDR